MSKADTVAFEYARTLGSDYNQIYDAVKHGYLTAEKDLELTWEDVKEICVQSVLVEVDLGGLVSDERHYTEVLKRFKATKENDTTKL